MDSQAAIAKVTSIVSDQGGQITAIQLKLMTFNQYVEVENPAFHYDGEVNPGWSPGSQQQLSSPDPSAVARMIVHADDPVWVVAFAGTWYPQGNAKAGGAFPAGIIVFNAKSGLPAALQWFADPWPPGFDSLPNVSTLPCVPA